jgi:hypothetical protein
MTQLRGGCHHSQHHHLPGALHLYIFRLGATPADFVLLNGNAHSLEFPYNYELFLSVCAAQARHILAR